MVHMETVQPSALVLSIYRLHVLADEQDIDSAQVEVIIEGQRSQTVVCRMCASV